MQYCPAFAVRVMHLWRAELEGREGSRDGEGARPTERGGAEGGRGGDHSTTGKMLGDRTGAVSAGRGGDSPVRRGGR